MTEPTLTLYARFAAHLDAVLDALEAEGALPAGARRAAPSRSSRRAIPRMAISPPTRRWCWPSPPAPIRARWPRLIVAQAGRAVRGVTSAEIAGPGFINIRLDRAVWDDELRAILAAGDDYGRSDMGARPARSTSNMSRPTRPGRCTWAIAAARWSATRSPPCSNMPGHEVIREYYVNDAGGQVDVARPLGAPALPRGARPARSARFPKASIRATI